MADEPIEIEMTALDTQRSAGIVCVAGDITDAITQYIAVKDALDKALPDCIMRIGNRSFRKKEYWRAVATAFNLDVQCITPGGDERKERGDDWGFELTYRAIAPNGRSADGDGSCYASEKRGQQATVHNVRAHAHTRAFNRSVSNLVGFGEVSADEINPEDFRDAPPPPLAPPPEPSGDVPTCPNCNGPMWDNRQTKTGRQPDFKCKDRSLGCKPGAIWLDDTPAKPKASQKEDRGHDPSWSADQKVFFFSLSELGWSYDECVYVCGALGSPRPSQLPPERRKNFVRWLADLPPEERDDWKKRFQQDVGGAPVTAEEPIF